MGITRTEALKGYSYGKMMIFGFYDGDGARKNINTNSKNIDMAFVRRESFLYRLPSGDSVDGQQNEPQ